MPQTQERAAFISGLIGKPYRPGADGPDEFDCYGLVRHVLAKCYAIELPYVKRPEDQKPAAEEVAQAITRQSVRAQWQAACEPQDGDVVVMANVDGREHHLGVYVVVDRMHIVLHTENHCGVVWDDLPSLEAKGFFRRSFFRRA